MVFDIILKNEGVDFMNKNFKNIFLVIIFLFIPAVISEDRVINGVIILAK